MVETPHPVTSRGKERYWGGNITIGPKQARSCKQTGNNNLQTEIALGPVGCGHSRQI